MPTGNGLRKRLHGSEELGIMRMAERAIDKSLAVIDAEAAAKPNGHAPRALEFFWVADIKPVLNGQFVVKGLIVAGSLIVVFGESNSGKTFFVIDLVLAIANGQPWRGRKVQRGLVIYIAGEGTDGIKNRIAAYQRRGFIESGIPLAIVNRAADLLHLDGDLAGVLALVAKAESESGEKCELIVVDTLARAMAGGDENSGEDMSALIANSDRLRRETGAAVLMIHHSGKDASKGARGHSSLRGAVDTEIAIEGQTGRRTATVLKQRDLPSGQVFAFELEQQMLGHDEDGDPVTSCIVRHLEEEQFARVRPKSKQQLAILTALEARQREAGKTLLWMADELSPLMRDLGTTHRNSRRAALHGLVEAGLLISTGGGWALKDLP
jgi:RecA-family ATPase